MRFFHSGDLGDLIYAIPSIRALCAQRRERAEVYLGSRPWTRSRWNEQLYGSIEPLLRAQGFSVFLMHGEEAPQSPFIDFSTFRNGGYVLGDTIIERQRRWVNAEIDLKKPWIHVEPDHFFAGKIIVNRASRWQGFCFPWKDVVRVFSGQLLFIGLESECEEFEREFGAISFHPTFDLLQVARIIAGAQFFIGSQSAPLAIANGLHKPSLVEACPYGPDCFYNRPHVTYCLDGKIDSLLIGYRMLVTDPVSKYDLPEYERGLIEHARKAWQASCNEILVH